MRTFARIALAVYCVALLAIAVWPVPVDRGAVGFIARVHEILPFVTHARVEFAANILLFVPLGVLLAVILERRYLVVPIALVTTVTIESVQGLALALRTPSVLDIIANLAGAAAGLLLVAAIEWMLARDEPPQRTTNGGPDPAVPVASGVGTSGAAPSAHIPAVPPLPVPPRPPAPGAAKRPESGSASGAAQGRPMP